jgi:hypothetical protein
MAWVVCREGIVQKNWTYWPISRLPSGDDYGKVSNGHRNSPVLSVFPPLTLGELHLAIKCTRFKNFCVRLPGWVRQADIRALWEGSVESNRRFKIGD